MIKHVKTNFMPADPLIKDMTHKVFHMVVVVKNVLV